MPLITEMVSTLATKTPMTAVANSGPEEPAAMKVAPATSGGKFNTAKQGENVGKQTAAADTLFGK